MPLVHPDVTILSNDDMISRETDEDHVHLFVPSLIKLYLVVDKEVRLGQYVVSLSHRPIPAGYEEFLYLWSRAIHPRYGHSSLRRPRSDRRSSPSNHLLRARAAPVPITVLVNYRRLSCTGRVFDAPFLSHRPNAHEEYAQIMGTIALITVQIRLRHIRRPTRLEGTPASIWYITRPSRTERRRRSRITTHEDDLLHRLLLRTAERALHAQDNACAGYQARDAKREHKMRGRAWANAIEGGNRSADDDNSRRGRKRAKNGTPVPGASEALIFMPNTAPALAMNDELEDAILLDALEEPAVLLAAAAVTVPDSPVGLDSGFFRGSWSHALRLQRSLRVGYRGTAYAASARLPSSEAVTVSFSDHSFLPIPLLSCSFVSYRPSSPETPLASINTWSAPRLCL
ncbi:hypothetical protein BC628DRAFT_439398 [Trametes gibbosa]|nr:hypothetical protein BC628DRAFT_439398 [Trametes gibbosa]